MKSRFMVENPDDIEMTMKITMTVGDWTKLRDQLQQKYPSWRLSGMITNLLSQARKVFYEEHETE